MHAKNQTIYNETRISEHDTYSESTRAGSNAATGATRNVEEAQYLISLIEQTLFGVEATAPRVIPKVTIRQCVDMYCEWRTKVAGMSSMISRMMKADLMKFANTIGIADKPVSAITSSAISAYINAPSPHRLSTKLKLLKNIRLFCRWLVDTGMLRINPALIVRVNRNLVPEQLQLPKPKCEITDYQIEKIRATICDELNEDWRWIFEVAIGTGLRLSDVIKIRHCDIIREGRYLYLVSVNKKTGTQTMHKFTPEMELALPKRWDPSSTERLTPKQHFLGSNLCSTAWIRYMRRIGIRKGNFHALRRVFARRMMQEGKNINDVSIALGHKQVATTDKYYI